MYFFFSSDAYDLYKRDIISALALPEGYCIHFRYPRNLLPDTSEFIQSLRGKEGIIVYVQGNKASTPVGERNVSFLPIRNVRVRDFVDSQTTGLVHVFLELGNFIKTTPDPFKDVFTSRQEIPPHKFIHQNDNPLGTIICQWHEKILELITFDNSFQNKLFYNLNIRNQEEFDKSQVIIGFDEAEKASFFQLTEEKNYTLELATYNSSEAPADYEKHSIKLDYNAENFFITNPQSIVIGADKDNRSFKIVTKEIKTSKSSSYIKIQSGLMGLDAKDNEIEIIACEEVIKLNIKQRENKSAIRFIVNLLSFTGPIMGAYGVSQLKPDGSLPYLWISGALICFVGISLFKKS